MSGAGHKGFVLVPRIVRLSSEYRNLTHGEKWLYVCLRDLCGEDGTCFRALRTLADETGIAFNSLGVMIKHLHDAGLIHAQKKRRPGGTRDVWHITITDIWAKNAAFLAQRKGQNKDDVHTEVIDDLTETVQEQGNNNVHFPNINVQIPDITPPQCTFSERQCSQNVIDKEPFNKTSLINKTKEEESTPTSSTAKKVSPPPSRQSQEKSSSSSHQQQPRKNAVNLSPEALAIYEAWCAEPYHQGLRPNLTQALAEQCTRAAAMKKPPSAEDMIKVREYAVAKDKWYRDHWDLHFLLKELPHWLAKSGSGGQSAPAVPGVVANMATMTHDEANRLAHDAIEQAKSYGYDIQAQAETSKKVEGSWIVRIKWPGESVPVIKSRDQWEKVFNEAHTFNVELAEKAARMQRAR